MRFPIETCGDVNYFKKRGYRYILNYNVQICNYLKQASRKVYLNAHDAMFYCVLLFLLTTAGYRRKLIETAQDV